VIASLAAFVDLVLTRTCGGCGEAGARWCGACAAHLTAVPRQHTLTDGTPVWSAAAYEGPVREAVNAWKDHDRTDLDRPLGLAVARCYTAAGVRADAVVPVPSSRSARRRRGREPVHDLARCLRRELRRAGAGDAPTVLAPLRQRRRVVDQAGLGAPARAANLAGALHVVPALEGRLHGRRLVVVDDVVTTGASIIETVRALSRAGAVVVGAVTVAATPRHRPTAEGVSRPDGRNSAAS
jgi:predicted amidophosphoribosyltransferase